METSQDHRWMSMAIAMGKRGLGRTGPNPSVGCVIVKDGRVLGRGTTADGGRPHAEPLALLQAGEAARGAVVYVTLEPCSHTGKSPPCVNALIAAAPSRVVVALQDPDPRVNGKGLTLLREAGIEVTTDVCSEQARTLHAGFVSRITRNRPRLILKLASSLDGKIATSTGDSQWITGPLARRHVHGQRALCDAVMIGAGTARNDDPALNVRGINPCVQPAHIVVTRDLNIPIPSKLTDQTALVPLMLVHGPDAKPQRMVQATAAGASLQSCKIDKNGQIDMAEALELCANAGFNTVYCEGGSALAASLLKNALVDELHLYSGGVAIGGDGLTCLGPLGTHVLSEAPRFEKNQVQNLGPDLFQRWIKR